VKARIGYEIFPDRFFSTSPKHNVLDWNHPLERVERSQHQYVFYGGDLAGIQQKLGYLEQLGVGFVYLTPIFQAQTNHRYDCTDFWKIDPLLGAQEDLERLVQQLHARHMRLVLDGVFNHIGKANRWVKDPSFYGFLNTSDGVPTHWANAPNLFELNLENPALRDRLWNAPDSVVQTWTRLGVDDWRLDCAYELGYSWLKELTSVLHSLGDHRSIGEIWSYPGKWVENGVMDGVMNYYFRELVFLFLQGKIDGELFGSSVQHCVKELGIQSLLQSWNMLSSHDTPRQTNMLGRSWELAVAFQYTLPGSPLVYYGEEWGLHSDGDPFCRQPMPWDSFDPGNPVFRQFQEWGRLFNEQQALHSGGFQHVPSGNPRVVAFWRKTPSILSDLLVVVNASEEEQKLHLITRESDLMNGFSLENLSGGTPLKIQNSILYGNLPPMSWAVYRVQVPRKGYSPYKRIVA